MEASIIAHVFAPPFSAHLANQEPPAANKLASAGRKRGGEAPGAAKNPAMSFMPGEPAPPLVNVSVASRAGTYTVGNPSFFRYIVRLAEANLALGAADREALEMLAAIPHAFFDDEEFVWGRGWRVVPPVSLDDWPVLESTPQRIRAALETARRILWENAAPVGVSAREIVAIENDLDEVFNVLKRAEDAGVPVSISYVS